MDVLLETAEREGTALGEDAEIVVLRLQLKSLFKMGKYKVASDLFSSRMLLALEETMPIRHSHFAIRANKNIGRLTQLSSCTLELSNLTV